MKRVRPLSANQKRVYRVLSRLMRGGLAHRLETTNAYVPWVDPRHGHDTAMFVICHGCGRSTRHMEAVS
jgi:Fe2+ or Zn2+ uptake regulation protein